VFQSDRHLLPITEKNYSSDHAREELRTRLSPDEVFVDFDHSLSAAENKLRGALCDSTTEGRFVETLPFRTQRVGAGRAGPSGTNAGPHSLRSALPAAGAPGRPCIIKEVDTSTRFLAFRPSHEQTGSYAAGEQTG
jgi:hypothetical protein